MVSFVLMEVILSEELLKNLLMVVVTYVTYVSFIPQIVLLYKTKNSKGVSISSWYLWGFSASCYLAYALLEGGFGLIVSALSEFVLTTTVLVLAIMYKGSTNGGENDSE